MVVSTPLRNPCALACQSIKSLGPERERTLLASFSSLKEPFKDLWKSITTWITLLYVVWPCFLKNCKNGSRHAFFFYQCTSCQIEIWIITHANPRGIHGRLHLCKVKWFCVLLRDNKTLTKRKRLPKSDKCLLTCQSHKYFWHLSKVYLKAVSQFLSALLEVLLQEKYGKNVYIYLDLIFFFRKYVSYNSSNKYLLDIEVGFRFRVIFWKQLIDWLFLVYLNKTIKHLNQKLLVSTEFWSST